jgi:hypothetical protein
MKDLIRTRFAAISVLILAGLLVGGCGGDSSTPRSRHQGPDVSGHSRPAAKSAKAQKMLAQGGTEPAKRAGSTKKRRPHRSASNQNKQSHENGSGESEDVVRDRLKGLLNDGGSGKKSVAASPKRIREVLQELEADAKEGGSENGVDATLGKVLGGS